MNFKTLENQYASIRSYDAVWSTLPRIISKGIFSFKSPSERHVYALSSITALSALMVNVTAKYDLKDIYPMVYVGVVAAPASNKSVINYARMLMTSVADEIRDGYKKALADYKLEHAQWITNKKVGVEPPFPAYQNPLIAADITKAKLIQQLQDNTGIPSFLISDEIDVIINSSHGQHGSGFSEILRTVFHHDTIEQQLKGGNQHYKTDTPKLSVLIAGTPQQMKSLSGNPENGFYSRFMVLLIDDGPVWKDVSPCSSCPDLKSVFCELSKEVLDAHHYFQSSTLQIKFTQEQWAVANDFGVQYLGDLYNKHNEVLAANVKRHALILIKIASTLTALRACQIKHTNDFIECSDIDFEAAYLIMRRSFADSVNFFKQLPGGALSKTASIKQSILEIMPTNFSRAEFITAAKRSKMSQRSADRLLRDLVNGGQLQKQLQGQYEKITLANLANDESDEDGLQ